MSRAFSRVCLSVRALGLTGKRLELATPNLVHVYSEEGTRHALTQRSKGQRSTSQGYENRHGARLLVTMVGTAYNSCAVLPAAVADVGLHFDTTAYVLLRITIVFKQNNRAAPYNCHKPPIGL